MAPSCYGEDVKNALMFCSWVALGFVACVPPGNSVGSADAGAQAAAAANPVRPSANIMTAPFEDDFERPDAGLGKPAPSASSAMLLPTLDAALADAAPLGLRDTGPRDAAGRDAALVDGALSLLPDAKATSEDAGSRLADSSNLGPNWSQARTNVWRIENGRLCGQGARNHGVWLNRVLPINARIEFDAISESADGDLKAEYWGDGRSAASGVSYNDATSYITVLGGWKNTLHVLARINEHGDDRKAVRVDREADDPRQRPVNRGQIYRFKVERTDGKTIRWFVDGAEMANIADAAPLAGNGHDHFAFNNWEVRVCFDNVRVTPL
jgi:hypothetical protein